MKQFDLNDSVFDERLDSDDDEEEIFGAELHKYRSLKNEAYEHL